jgi:hypothetical protein
MEGSFQWGFRSTKWNYVTSNRCQTKWDILESISTRLIFFSILWRILSSSACSHVRRTPHEMSRSDCCLADASFNRLSFTFSNSTNPLNKTEWSIFRPQNSFVRLMRLISPCWVCARRFWFIRARKFRSYSFDDAIVRVVICFLKFSSAWTCAFYQSLPIRIRMATFPPD